MLKDLSESSETDFEGVLVSLNLLYKRPNMISFKIDNRSDNRNIQHLVMVGDTLINDDLNKNDTLNQALFVWFNPFPELEFKKRGYKLELTPRIQRVDGHLVYLVTATSPDGFQFKYYYDYTSGLKIRETRYYPNRRYRDFDDYRTINNAIQVPFSQNLQFNEHLLKFKMKSAITDSGISNDQFK